MVGAARPRADSSVGVVCTDSGAGLVVVTNWAAGGLMDERIPDYDDLRPRLRRCEGHWVNILATFAEFEVDLLRMRTREGMAVARAKGKLKGEPPKLSPAQRALLLKLRKAGEHTIAEPAELFSVSRATVYRELARPRGGRR